MSGEKKDPQIEIQEAARKRVYNAGEKLRALVGDLEQFGNVDGSRKERGVEQTDTELITQARDEYRSAVEECKKVGMSLEDIRDIWLGSSGI